MVDENELVLGLLNRFLDKSDEDAFEELVLLYEKRVYLQALRLCGNHQDALEIAQESFLKLYRSAGSFKGQSSFKTWFYRLVNNTAYDLMRKRQRDNQVFIRPGEEEEDLDLPDQNDLVLPQEVAERAELQSLVKEALQSLTSEHREILYLYDFESLSYEEISEHLNCQLGTVKSRLFRARQALKREVLKRKEHFGEYLRQLGQEGGC